MDKRLQHMKKRTKDIYIAVMADLGCQLDTPGKRKPQLRSSLHQIGL